MKEWQDGATRKMGSGIMGQIPGFSPYSVIVGEFGAIGVMRAFFQPKTVPKTVLAKRMRRL